MLDVERPGLWLGVINLALGFPSSDLIGDRSHARDDDCRESSCKTREAQRRHSHRSGSHRDLPPCRSLTLDSSRSHFGHLVAIAICSDPRGTHADRSRGLALLGRRLKRCREAAPGAIGVAPESALARSAHRGVGLTQGIIIVARGGRSRGGTRPRARKRCRTAVGAGAPALFSTPGLRLPVGCWGSAPPAIPLLYPNLAVMCYETVLLLVQ